MYNQNYTDIAKAISKIRPKETSPDYDNWVDVVQTLSDICEKDNVRFKREIFEEDCGVYD